MIRGLHRERTRKMLAKKLYWLVDFYVGLKLRNSHIESPILVLTPGKVASSTAAATLRQYRAHVYQIHNWSSSSIANSISRSINGPRGYPPLHLLYSKHLKTILPSSARLEIVCISREPVAREISSVFQNLDDFDGLFAPDWSINGEKVMELVERRLMTGEFLDEVDKWIYNELQEELGLDLKSVDFSEGYAIVESPRCRALFFKSECVDQSFIKGCKSFWSDFGDIELQPRNIASKKYYNEAYLGIKEQVDLSLVKDHSRYMESLYVKTFYPPN